MDSDWLMIILWAVTVVYFTWILNGIDNKVS